MGGAAELPRPEARLPHVVERGAAAGGVARVRSRRRRTQHLWPWRGGRGGGTRGRPSQRECGAAAAVGRAQPRPRGPRGAWLARTLATPPHSRQRVAISGGGAACVSTMCTECFRIAGKSLVTVLSRPRPYITHNSQLCAQTTKRFERPPITTRRGALQCVYTLYTLFSFVAALSFLEVWLSLQPRR